MKQNHISFLLFLGLMACSSPQQETASVPIDITRSVLEVSDLADGYGRADLSIEGMSCEMMCGGAIKKALAGVEGVESTDIEFDAEKDLDHAIVTYLTDEVDDNAIIAAVHAIHDGVYQVKEVSIELPEGSNAETTSNGTQSDVRTSVAEELPEIHMPSLMDLISSIIQL